MVFIGCFRFIEARFFRFAGGGVIGLAAVIIAFRDVVVYRHLAGNGGVYRVELGEQPIDDNADSRREAETLKAFVGDVLVVIIDKGAARVFRIREVVPGHVHAEIKDQIRDFQADARRHREVIGSSLQPVAILVLLKSRMPEIRRHKREYANALGRIGMPDAQGGKRVVNAYRPAAHLRIIHISTEGRVIIAVADAHLELNDIDAYSHFIKMHRLVVRPELHVRFLHADAGSGSVQLLLVLLVILFDDRAGAVGVGARCLRHSGVQPDA